MDKKEALEEVEENCGGKVNVFWDRGNGPQKRLCKVIKGKLYQIEGGNRLLLGRVGYENLIKIEVPLGYEGLNTEFI